MNKGGDITRRNFITLAGKGVIISAFLPDVLMEFSRLRQMPATPPKNSNEYIADPNAYILQLNKFTATYKKYLNAPAVVREIECLKIQHQLFFCDMLDHDLFAGRSQDPPIGLVPQVVGSFGYYIEERRMKAVIQSPRTNPECRAIGSDLIEYWNYESSEEKLRRLYSPEMKEVFASENWPGEPLIGAPLYRMSGTQCDFDKLITLGICGLRKEVGKYKDKVQRGSKSYELYVGMEKACDMFGDVALGYADKASKQAITSSGERKKELLQMESVLRKISTAKPETLREAIQLVLLYSDICGTINYGRMDEYLGDLYASDLKKGILNEEEAIRLLTNLWALIDAKGNIWDSRVIIGGKGRRNEKNADKFALIAMETTQRVRGIVPQFTLRFYKGQNPELYKKGLDMIASGNPYPLLYNDEVIVPSVMRAFNVTYIEAVNYVPFGCGEYVLYHRSVGTPSGVINLLQALSVTLHKGTNPVNKKLMGLTAAKLGDFDTFNSLFDAYKKNVELFVEQLAYQERMEYDMAGNEAPFLYLSMVFDDCIKQGKGIFAGGVRYLGGTLESYGNTNTADSLAAIKKLVYDEKKLTLDQVVKIIDSDFAGYEKERRMMLDAPKYGNDNDYADNIKIEVDRHICSVARNMAENARLHSYLVVLINNSANTTMGMLTAASPDGRKAFTYMANANAPTGGADKNGVTAFLNSIVKPDTGIHAGSVQNMKFSKDMFTVYRDKTEALLKTYFDNGGAQCMINCIGREDLENAIKHPELYANLIVRVGGFCAKFVELPAEVQREILSRTMY